MRDLKMKPPKFTQGDYRRFCALFYLQTRRLLKETEFLMAREKKKRMMPRHLLTAAVLSGTIPNSLLAGDGRIAVEEVKRLEIMMTPKRPPERAKSQGAVAVPPKAKKEPATAGQVKRGRPS